jgi:hypothetical protein
MAISPLRQRMTGDMTARHFGEKTQKDYIRCVKNLTAFIGRPPGTATVEDLRLFRLHLVQSPLGAAKRELEHDRAAVLLRHHAREARSPQALVSYRPTPEATGHSPRMKSPVFSTRLPAPSIKRH